MSNKKSELIKKLRDDANTILKVCKEAEESGSITAEELEKRISKSYFDYISSGLE
jgi:hypothetical protein